MRWEATGPTEDLFPILDADLLVTKHGEDQVRLALTGSYRPPLGRFGQTLDRAIMHTVATATVRSLLGSLADSIAQQSQQLRDAGQSLWWRPILGPQEPG